MKSNMQNPSSFGATRLIDGNVPKSGDISSFWINGGMEKLIEVLVVWNKVVSFSLMS
jgi:hypothetical protein